MKILHILYDDVENPWVGGGGAVRAREINRYLAEKHSITTITGNFPGAQNEVIDNIRFVRVGFGGRYLLSRITFTLLIPFHIYKYDCDLVVNEFSAFSPVFCGLFTRKPVIHTFYHRMGFQALRKIPVFGITALLFENIFLKTAKNIITISTSVTEDIKKTGDIRRIECIFTGVDASLFSIEPEPGEYIAYMGRIDIYMKGIDILLEAFRNLSDKSVVLKVAGTGPQKNIKRVRRIIDKLQINDRVFLLGKISDEDKKEFLKRAYFLVMPSRFEGWGITAIEAAACGKPVIGTDIPGLKDAVLDKQNGFLVESENAGALTKSMNRLMEDNQLRTDMGRKGKDWAQNFQWNEIAAKQEKFYSEIVGA